MYSNFYKINWENGTSSYGFVEDISQMPDIADIQGNPHGQEVEIYSQDQLNEMIFNFNEEITFEEFLAKEEDYLEEDIPELKKEWQEAKGRNRVDLNIDNKSTLKFFDELQNPLVKYKMEVDDELEINDVLFDALMHSEHSVGGYALIATWKDGSQSMVLTGTNPSKALEKLSNKKDLSKAKLEMIDIDNLNGLIMDGEHETQKNKFTHDISGNGSNIVDLIDDAQRIFTYIKGEYKVIVEEDESCQIRPDVHEDIQKELAEKYPYTKAKNKMK